MPLTWSISRDQTLHTCERRYYFQYLAPARINSRESALKEIALLKKLKNIPMWQGEVFHSAVANYVKAVRRHEPVSIDTLSARAEKRMNVEWDFSVKRGFRGNPRAVDKEGGLALFEHEYDVEGAEERYGAAVQFVEQRLQRFLRWSEGTNLRSEIQRAVDTWIEPAIYGLRALGFVVDGVKVIVKVDLAIRKPDGKFEIFDWKTGTLPGQRARQVNQAEFQMGVYQLWPHLGLQQPLEHIQAHLVYLGNEPTIQQTFGINQNVQEYTLSLIHRSISRVVRFSNASTDTKIGLEDFDFAAFAAACKLCSFKRLCQRTLEQ